MSKSNFKRLIILSAVLISAKAFATPNGLTFQGRLVDNGIAVESASVILTLKVTSPTDQNECVLFEETHTLNMTNSDGIFTVKIGGGSPTANDKGFSLEQVFSNTGTQITGLSCVSGTTYTPTSGHSRNVFVSFDDNGNQVAFTSPYVIQSVPYAIEAQRLAGKPASSYLQTTTDTTQTKLNDLMVPATYTDLLALINGTSAKYMTSSTSAPATMPVLSSQPASPTEGQFWYYNGNAYYRTGSQTKAIGTGTVTSVTAGTGLTGGAITGSGTIALEPNVIATPGTYRSVAVDTYGRVTAGTNPTTVADYGITDAVVKGGQTGALTLGTSDSNALTLNTNNSAKMTILPNGNVGIGTANPTSPLYVTSAGPTTSPLFAAGGWVTANGASGIFRYRSTASQIGSTTAVGAQNTIYPNAAGMTFASAVSGELTHGSGAADFMNGYGVYGSWAGGSQVNTFTNVAALGAKFQVGGGTVTNAYGLRVLDFTTNGNGTLTNTYGVYIGDVTPAGVTQTNTPFSIYASDVNARNYFAGNVGIGTTSPQSTLQVNGYVQLALTSGAPPATDCDAAAERGRMKVDNVAGVLYICADSGWVAK